MRITSDASSVSSSVVVAPTAIPPYHPHPALALLPLGIFGVALVTIVTAYHATFRHGILDFQHGKVVTPPISMLMFAGPGRRMGQIGFPTVSLLFGCCAPRFFKDIERSLHLVNRQQEEHTATPPPKSVLVDQEFRTTLWLLKMTSGIAFLCLAIVGLIPLQSNLPDVFYASSRAQQTLITWDSVVHQVSAGFFFIMSMIHMGLWLRFTMQCPSSQIYHYQTSSKSFAFKLVCLGLCFFPLPTAFLLHPISPLKHRLALTDADAGGITQYALVTCVASFFASYSYELWYLQKDILLRQQQQQDLHSQSMEPKKND